MGFNTTILIRNADLPAIAKDESFGERISNAVRAADVVEFKMMKDGRPRTGLLTSADLAAYDRDVGTDYVFDLSTPVHADLEQVHDVHEGHLTSFRLAGDPAPYEGYERLAALVAQHGYTVSDKATGQKWTPEDTAKVSHADWIGGAGTEALLDRGHTALLIINDGLSDIAGDKTIGARLQRDVQTYAAAEKQLHELHSKGTNLAGFHLSDSIGAGNHANCVQIIGITPENGYDAFVSGRNWGLMLRPYSDTIDFLGNEGVQERRSNLKADRVREVADLLHHSGFHVRAPGQSRAKSPSKWNMDHWPVRPEEPDTGPSF